MEKHKNNSRQNNPKKTKYMTPEISCIVIDNDISLTLDSTPPTGSGEDIGMNYYVIDPLKSKSV